MECKLNVCESTPVIRTIFTTVDAGCPVSAEVKLQSLSKCRASVLSVVFSVYYFQVNNSIEKQIESLAAKGKELAKRMAFLRDKLYREEKDDHLLLSLPSPPLSQFLLPKPSRLKKGEAICLFTTAAFSVLVF